MTNDEVVAALKKIAETGFGTGISADDLRQLKAYTLIDILPLAGNSKRVPCILTKKGKVMLKANSKPAE